MSSIKASALEREKLIKYRERLAENIDAILFKAYFPPRERDEITDRVRRVLAVPPLTSEYGLLPAVGYKPPAPRCEACGANMLLEWCYRESCPMRERREQCRTT